MRHDTSGRWNLYLQCTLAQGLRLDQGAAAANVGLRFIIELEAGKATARIGKDFAVRAGLGMTITLDGPSAASARNRACHKCREWERFTTGSSAQAELARRA